MWASDRYLENPRRPRMAAHRQSQTDPKRPIVRSNGDYPRDVVVGTALLARASAFTSMHGVPKEFQHLGIELLVKCRAIEVRRLRADVVRGCGQLVGARGQERKVLGVWNRAKVGLHRQFVRDGSHAFGRHPVSTVLGTPELHGNPDLVKGSLREEDAQRVSNDQRLDAPVVDQRYDLALTNVLANRAGLAHTHSLVPAELRIGTRQHEPRVPAS